MFREVLDSDVELAVFAVLGFEGAGILVLGEFLRLELLAAVLAGLVGMEVLVVLFEVVDVNHFVALRTPLDVAPAISEMAVDFGLGKFLSAVVALLDRLHMNNLIVGNTTKLIYNAASASLF